MTLRHFVFCVFALLAVSHRSQAEVPLPTPKDHYGSFDPAQAGLKLFTEMMGEADPSIQKMMMDLASALRDSRQDSPSRGSVATGRGGLEKVEGACARGVPPLFQCARRHS